MATPSKAAITPDPIVLAQLVLDTNFLGSALDFSTKFSGAIYWDFAPFANTAGAAATMLQLLSANKETGLLEDDSWGVVQEWLSPTATSTLFSANVTGVAGASTITVAAGSPTLYQDHFLGGASEASGEWIYPILQVGTTVTLRAALKNSYAGATMYSNALRQRFEQDFTNLKQYKLVLFNKRGATNRNVVNRVRIMTLDSVA